MAVSIGQLEVEATSTVSTADRRDLMTAQDLEVMEIKTFFQLRRESQDWRYRTQLLCTAEIMVTHRVPVYKFCLAEKSYVTTAQHVCFHRH